MNNADRQKVHFDEAAEQAKRDGVSGCGEVKVSQKAMYEQAANKRGCSFVIDSEGKGTFLDDDQCRYDEDAQEVVWF